MSSYPSAAKTFTTKSNTTTADASHINDVQSEITAIEQDLIAAFPGGSAASGQIKFPAVQNPSADANTLDDYEEGTWTPVITFSTPGDLNVAYATQQGLYTKIGRQVTLQFALATSAFTHTTAAGSLQITGVPFTSSNGTYIGAMYFQGVTKATYTQVSTLYVAATAFLTLFASGSGVAAASVTATDMPTGGGVSFVGTITYFV